MSDELWEGQHKQEARLGHLDSLKEGVVQAAEQYARMWISGDCDDLVDAGADLKEAVCHMHEYRNLYFPTGRS